MTTSTPAGIIEIPAVITAREQVATDVVALTLARTDGAPLPGWTPGSHIDAVLPNGEVRQYSLCGEPGSPEWRIAVLLEHDGRGGSDLLHEQGVVGFELGLRGPRNHFEYLGGSAPVLFVAGGIGITPLLSMMRAADAAGREWSLAYAGRCRAGMAFADELDASSRVSLHASDAASGRLDLAELVAAQAPGTWVYCCGPARLIDALTELVPSARLHVERFEPKELDDPMFGEPFEVELAITGTTLVVPPDRSILEVVEESGVLVLSSCQEGTCGTCETPVLEGEVEHRDSILTPDERADNTVMYICVSRAACPRLVLEL